MSEIDPAGAGGPGPSSAPGLYGKASGPRASFWRRLVAGLIDGLIVYIVYLLIAFVVKNSGALTAIGALLGLAYTTYLEGGVTGQSIGKRLMGTRVVDATTGGPIGYGRGAIRYVVGVVSGVACALGYLWMLWDGEKQTWHDKASSSYVVPVSAYPVQQQ